MLEVCAVFYYFLLWLKTIDVCIWRMLFLFVVEVCGNVCCVVAVIEDSVFSNGVLKYVVCLCKGCDGCCIFC